MALSMLAGANAYLTMLKNPANKSCWMQKPDADGFRKFTQFFRVEKYVSGKIFTISNFT